METDDTQPKVYRCRRRALYHVTSRISHIVTPISILIILAHVVVESSLDPHNTQEMGRSWGKSTEIEKEVDVQLYSLDL